MRTTILGGMPIKQYDSPNKGGTMTGHKGVVLHIAQGTYLGTIAWQMNPDQRYSNGDRVTTCSTWIVGRNRGEWAQMVDSNRIAWCQRAGSLDWLSIELAGFAPQAPSAWQIEACSRLLAWCNKEYAVPLVVTSNTGARGLGHHSMDNDTTVQWGHDACPGAGVVAAKPAIVSAAVALSGGESVTQDEIERIAQAVWDHRIASPGLNRTAAASDWQKDAYGAGLTLKDVKGAVENLANRPPVTVDVAQLAELLYNAMPAAVLTREEVRAACEEAVRAVAGDAATP